MDLYITFDSKEKIKKAFLNLRKYVVISTSDIIKDLGYTDELDDCSRFLVNEEIKNRLQKGSNRKKVLALIYTNQKMDDLAIRELVHFCSTVSSIHNVIFLVEKGKKEEYYELFEEVVFYPAVKKVHIIDCATLPVSLLSDLSN